MVVILCKQWTVTGMNTLCFRCYLISSWRCCRPILGFRDFSSLPSLLLHSGRYHHVHLYTNVSIVWFYSIDACVIALHYFLSTVSSSINSLGAVFLEDFAKPFQRWRNKPIRASSEHIYAKVLCEFCMRRANCSVSHIFHTEEIRAHLKETL